jgi:hypothetical protein
MQGDVVVALRALGVVGAESGRGREQTEQQDETARKDDSRR